MKESYLSLRLDDAMIIPDGTQFCVAKVSSWRIPFGLSYQDEMEKGRTKVGDLIKTSNIFKKQLSNWLLPRKQSAGSCQDAGKQSANVLDEILVPSDPNLGH